MTDIKTGEQNSKRARTKTTKASYIFRGKTSSNGIDALICYRNHIVNVSFKREQIVNFDINVNKCIDNRQRANCKSIMASSMCIYVKHGTLINC